MPINQIFKKKIPLYLIEDVLKKIGIKSKLDIRFFSKNDIEKNKDEIFKKIRELEDFYIPCKRKIYFSNLNSLKVINIIRQCLKLHDISLVKKEKYIKEKNKKILFYQINEKVNSNNISNNINNNSVNIEKNINDINKNSIIIDKNADNINKNIIIKRVNIVLDFD